MCVSVTSHTRDGEERERERERGGGGGGGGRRKAVHLLPMRERVRGSMSGTLEKSKRSSLVDGISWVVG